MVATSEITTERSATRGETSVMLFARSARIGNKAKTMGARGMRFNIVEVRLFRIYYINLSRQNDEYSFFCLSWGIQWGF